MKRCPLKIGGNVFFVIMSKGFSLFRKGKVYYALFKEYEKEFEQCR